ncbi:MAG: SH3 domain-containing protein [Blautia sp.]
MDNFREWLSDNLRYIILGAGILVILTGLFFGIRAVSGIMKGDSTAQTQQEDRNNKGNDPSSPTDGEPSEKNDDVSDNPLEQDKYPEVNALITTYYNALGSKDVATLKTVVDALDPAEETKIQNAKYIDGYQDLEVHTKQGLDENSYIVYACYNYVCTGIATPVPAMSQLYVKTDADGKLYIVGDTTSDSKLSALLDEDLQTQDVKALWNQVDDKYNKAKESDPALAQFLNNLGTESSTAASAGEGAQLTAKEACNIREAASSDAEVIGSLSAGDTITKTGMEGDWVQVEYEGETGYIFSELLR